MNETEREILKKIMKKLDTSIRICIQKTWKQHKESNLQELLIWIRKKCKVGSSGGMSESDYKILLEEVNSKLQEIEDTKKEIEQELGKSKEDIQEIEKKLDKTIEEDKDYSFNKK